MQPPLVTHTTMHVLHGELHEAPRNCFEQTEKGLRAGTAGIGTAGVKIG
ncbi:hypothetical protein Desti_4602 [Desulfomonile tiedjei DSM 6799]|uniref:Uncharacterized protein n=1 Tax=Desulfomonile tiedjei (strain ATCC 49306 / DSM 6799 / DCB-1) TaxID=706587 RepID=I4CCD7_DESTA|nr:hypothetical protein Desti_4602 [Desulfomonile tiedjei DSM 6799]